MRDNDCYKSQCGRDPDQEYDPDTLANPNPNQCTLCTGDVSDNIFFVPRATGYQGRCMLDEMTYDQISLTLSKVPKAKEDLIRITDDQILLRMARTSRLKESPLDEDEKMRKKLHENSLPFYTVLGGNVDGSIVK